MQMFEKMRKYAVKADSIRDFCERFHKREAYHDRGHDYMEHDLKSHVDEFKRNGFTMIPKGTSTTGEIVTYYAE